MIGANTSTHRGRAPRKPTHATVGLSTATTRHATDDVESGGDAGAASMRVTPAVCLAAILLLITVGGALGTPVEPGNTGSLPVNAQTKVNERTGVVTILDAVDSPTEEKMTVNENATAGLEFHPLADILPMMAQKEFEALVDDIRAHGQLEPVTVHDGKIVDGRNRYRACLKLGKVPDVVQWDGRGSLAAFVASRNIHRRHLTPSQLAMFGGRLVDEFAKEAKGNMSLGGQGLADLPTVHSRDRAAQTVNVSSRLVGSAEKVLKDGVPTLVEAVKQGAVAVTAAADLAGLPPEEQAEVLAQGPKAARAKAAAIRRAKKAEQPQGTSPEPQTGGGVVPVTSPPMAAAEDQLPDKKWLKRFPIRSKLSPESLGMFDREALYFRGLRKLNTDYFRCLNELDGRFNAEGPGSFVGYCDRIDLVKFPPDFELADALLFAGHPDSWEICTECEGWPDSEDDEPCPTCCNVGFHGPPMAWINLEEQPS